MIVGWQRAKNGLRNAGLRVLVFALVSAPAAMSAADDPSARSFIKTSDGMQKVDFVIAEAGRYPVDEQDQFDIRNDGSDIWNILKAATARAAQSREARERNQQP